MICDPGSVAIVPFPFVDAPVFKWRPALVLSTRDFNEAEQQTVLAMITTLPPAGGGAISRLQIG